MNPYVAAQLSLRFSFLFVWHFLPALTAAFQTPRVVRFKSPPPILRQPHRVCGKLSRAAGVSISLIAF